METCPTCPLCMCDVAFPVFLTENVMPLGCNCRREPMCLTCVRDMLDKNNEEVDAEIPYSACFYCRKELRLPRNMRMTQAKNIYTKDYVLADQLDSKFGNMTCPRCNEWEGSRLDWTNVHMTTCPCIQKRCNDCGQNYSNAATHHAECQRNKLIQTYIQQFNVYENCLIEFRSEMNCGGIEATFERLNGYVENGSMELMMTIFEFPLRRITITPEVSNDDIAMCIDDIVYRINVIIPIINMLDVANRLLYNTI